MLSTFGEMGAPELSLIAPMYAWLPWISVRLKTAVPEISRGVAPLFVTQGCSTSEHRRAPVVQGRGKRKAEETAGKTDSFEIVLGGDLDILNMLSQSAEVSDIYHSNGSIQKWGGIGEVFILSLTLFIVFVSQILLFYISQIRLNPHKVKWCAQSFAGIKWYYWN